MRDTQVPLRQRSVGDAHRALALAVAAGVYLLLATPLVANPGVWPGFVLPGALYARTVTLFTVALWVALALGDRRYRPPRAPIPAAAGLFVLINLLAAATGLSPERSLWSTQLRMGGVVGLAHWTALVVVLASVFRTYAQWRWLFGANLGVSLLVVVIGLGQGLGLEQVGAIYRLGSADRLMATVGNPGYLAAYLLVSLLLALALLAASRPRLEQQGRAFTAWQAFLLGTVAFSGWALIQTATRGAVVGAIAGLAAWALAYALWGDRPRLRLVAAGSLGVAVLVGGLWFAVRDTPAVHALASRVYLVERLRRASLEDPTAVTRVEMVRAGLAAFRERPVLGWGPENAEPVFEKYVSARFFAVSPEWGDRLHNRVVEELVDRGILGLLAYLGLWGLLLRAVIARARGARHRDRSAQGSGTLYMGIGAALVAYFVQNLFLFDTNEGMLQLALLVGFLASSEGKTEDRVSGHRPVMPKGVHAAVCVLLVTIAAIGTYRLHYPPYRQAVLMGAALRTGWMSDRLRIAEQAFAAFPPMANMARVALFKTVMGSWPQMSPGQRQAAIAVLERQMPQVLKGEPMNVPMRAVAAVVYQLASVTDAAYMDKAARSVREVSVRMRPHRPLSKQLAETQRKLEEWYSRHTTPPVP